MNLKDILAPVLPKGKFWTQAWSLVEGCTPVSPGCENCWLAALEHRFGRYADRDCLVDVNGAFTGAVRIRDDRLNIPLHKRKPQVFAIWSDLFHESVSRGFQEGAFGAMAVNPHHYFIVVTKRPAVAVGFLSESPGKSWNRPLSNAIILVTMEDQQRADERAPYALQLAAQGWTVGALCEPLLGPVSLNHYLEYDGTNGEDGAEERGWGFNSWSGGLIGKGEDANYDPQLGLDWIITGPENGPGKRPFNPTWAAALRDQAQEAGVPFFYKAGALDGHEWLEVPAI